MNSRSLRFFKVAAAVGLTSDYVRVNIGAVIVQNNDVISVGVNKNRSHPTQRKYNYIYRFTENDGCNTESKHLLHAEMDAIVKAKHLDLTGASIYVSRRTINGKLGMCRPCPACMGAIIDVGITDIYYTSADGHHYEHINSVDLQRLIAA